MQESGEMYLKTILILLERKGNVKAIDVATELNYSKASVSRGIKVLKEKKYVYTDEKNNLLFTPQGLKYAKKIKERHVYLTKFLMDTLNADYNHAYNDACRIEHVISDEVFDLIKKRYKD